MSNLETTLGQVGLHLDAARKFVDQFENEHVRLLKQLQSDIAAGQPAGSPEYLAAALVQAGLKELTERVVNVFQNDSSFMPNQRES